MNECPLCRKSLNNTYFTKCYLLNDLLIDEFNLLNYYSLNKQVVNIIDFYSRKNECPICYDRMTEPIILSCGHIICSKCNNHINWNDKHIFNKFNDLLFENKYLTLEMCSLLKSLIKINDRFLESKKEVLLINKINKKLLKELKINKKINSNLEWKNKQYKMIDSLNKKLILKQNIKIKYLYKKSKFKKKKVRNKICKYWLRNCCRYTNHQCFFAHGPTFLNTKITIN